MRNEEIPQELLAKRGRVTVTLLSDVPETAPVYDRAYRVSVTLSDAAVVHEDGAVESLPDTSFVDVGVGWLPG